MKKFNLILPILIFLLFAIFDFANSYVYKYEDWLNLPSVKTIHSITTDFSNVYIGTPDAIYIFDKSENQVIRTLTSSDGITGFIRICAYDRESGFLWVVADDRLIGFNPRTNFMITLYPDFFIRSLGVNSSYLYFLTDGKPQRMQKFNRTFKTVNKLDTNLIWYGEKQSYNMTDYSFLVPYFYIDENIVRRNITIVFEDRKTLWVGADEYGILTYDLATKQQIARFQLGPNIGTIDNIFKVNQDLWFVGTTGFYEYLSQSNAWHYYLTPFGVIFSSSAILLQPKILDLRRIQGISSMVQEKNNFWIGSGDRIYLYDLKSNVLTPVFTFPVPIQKISLMDDGLFFIAKNELYQYQAKTKRIDTVADPYQKLAFGVFDIFTTSSRYYFSVYGGFLSLNRDGTWQHHIPPGIDLSIPFTSLAGFEDYLFIGTYNGLIAYNENTERYDYFTTKEGLLSNQINALYADSNYVWIASDRGISRFSYRRVLP